MFGVAEARGRAVVVAAPDCGRLSTRCVQRMCSARSACLVCAALPAGLCVSSRSLSAGSICALQAGPGRSLCPADCHWRARLPRPVRLASMRPRPFALPPSARDCPLFTVLSAIFLNFGRTGYYAATVACRAATRPWRGTLPGLAVATGGGVFEWHPAASA